MIKSMTAFAKAAHESGHITADVTIRSYNSKGLDFAVYLPEACRPLEEDIKKLVSAVIQRGRVEIRVNIQDDTPEADLFEVDAARAASYYRALVTVKETLNFESSPTMEQVLAAGKLILPKTVELDTDLLWDVVSKAVETAVNDLDGMRASEGANLFADLSGRINDIEMKLADVEKLAREIPAIYKQRLMERLERLTADIPPGDSACIDPVRLAQEAAILADKSDVSEEIVRLHSHISQFRQIMDTGQSQGRKLNFLIQEFNREFNTIGSKSGHADLSHMVVDLKSELEKIREQVQNIE